MTFKRDDHVTNRHGVKGIVRVPAYEKVPYVQVDYGTHTGWCYPHELVLDEDWDTPEWDLDDTLSDEHVPEHAKAVLYGYRKGFKACEAQIKALAEQKKETPKSRGFADVFTEAQAHRRKDLPSKIADEIYYMPISIPLGERIKAADKIIGLVREAYPSAD